MIVDAVDATGRRYQAATAEYFSEDCVECGTTIAIGCEYFMRNDANDGTQKDGLAAALMELTYDAVCKSCGERQLQSDSH